MRSYENAKKVWILWGKSELFASIEEDPLLPAINVTFSSKSLFSEPRRFLQKGDIAARRFLLKGNYTCNKWLGMTMWLFVCKGDNTCDIQLYAKVGGLEGGPPNSKTLNCDCFGKNCRYIPS